MMKLSINSLIWPVRILTGLLVFVMALSQAANTSAQTGPSRLSFAPTTQTISGINRNGAINVHVNPGGATTIGVQIIATFNPSVVRVNSITPGAFFTNTGLTPEVIIETIDNTAGRIQYVVAFPAGSNRSSTTANNAAVISFTTIGAGTSNFNFITTGAAISKVININGSNTLGGVTAGSVVVTGTGTPQPTQPPTITNRPSPTPPGSGNTTPQLYFTPTTQNISGSGRTGTINAFLDPKGRGVIAAELVISFNPSVIRVDSITPGGFFPGTPRVITTNINNTTGRIQYSIGLPLGNVSPVTTANSIARINFTTIGAGTSNFAYQTSNTISTFIADINAQNINPAFSPGTVVVSGSGGTPTAIITNPPTITIVDPSTTPQPDPGSLLSFAPTSQTLNGTNRTGNVNIVVNPRGQRFYAAEMIINFNPSVVRVDNITPGTVFGSVTPREIIKNIDNSAGRIQYAVGFPLGSTQSVTTSGIVAQISFTSTGNGTSPLTFNQSSLVSNFDGNPITGQLGTGSIIIAGGNPPPTSPTKAPDDDDDDDDEEDDDDDEDDEKPEVTITANPMSVQVGGSTTITWTSNGAVFCNGSAGTDGWAGEKELSGSFTVNNLQTTTSFGIICGSEREDRGDKDLNDDDGDETAKKVTVQVEGSGPTPTISPTPEGCYVTNSGGWTNVSISAKTGNYIVTFDATPKEVNDSYVGTSNGAANTFTDLTSIIHFTHNGTVVARDDIQYSATQIFRYSAGQTYDIRLVVNAVNKTYSAFIAPRGGQEKQIAQDFSFRLEQQNTESVNNIAMFSRSTSDGLKICNVNSPAPTEPTPTVEVPSPSPTPIACTPTDGDANGDSIIDTNDYLVWDNNFGQVTSAGPSAGDFNCDKKVDGVDYVIWLIGLIRHTTNPN